MRWTGELKVQHLVLHLRHLLLLLRLLLLMKILREMKRSRGARGDGSGSTLDLEGVPGRWIVMGLITGYRINLQSQTGAFTSGFKITPIIF